MKKIPVDPELIGKLIGFVLLFTLILVAPYVGTAFVQWTLDAGEWPTDARLTSAGISALLFLGWWLLNVLDLRRG